VTAPADPRTPDRPGGDANTRDAARDGAVDVVRADLTRHSGTVPREEPVHRVLRVTGARLDRPTPEPRPQGSGGWIRRLSPFLWAHRRSVVLAFGAAILGQGVNALTPIAEKVVIDDGIVTQTRPVWPWLLALLAAGLFAFASSYVRRWQGGRVALDVQFDLRNAIYERLQRLDFAGHDKLQTGQLVSRASSDLGLVQAVLSFLPIVIGNIALMVVSLVVMLFLSPPLTLVMLVTVPLLLVVSLRMRATVFPATWDAQQHAGEVAGVVDEAVTGVRVVKGFGQEDRELEHLTGAAGGLYRSRSRLVRVQARYSPTLQAIPSLAQAAVLAFGGWLALEGHITLGVFLAFSSYLVQMVAPVRMLAGLFAIGQQARAGAERILDVLDANPLVVERDDAVELPEAEGRVRFDGVRFGYTTSQPVLDGLDLDVAPGEIVALVGASGSGKSTVTALLPRFYDVASGSVSIDGHDVRDVTLESLRRQVGVVFEEAFLFSDTVWANIAYGQPDATDDQVRAAAAAAGALAFVEALPEGFDTVVGERGLTLSGGQRQRIALARAILTNPRVLVLDDATSAVDAATEEAIHATLREIMADRTTILIAHRRSTLRLAQRIVVMERGRVLEQGTHEELLATSEAYRLLLTGPGDQFDADDRFDVDGRVDSGAGASAPDGRGPGAFDELRPLLERARDEEVRADLDVEIGDELSVDVVLARRAAEEVNEAATDAERIDAEITDGELAGAGAITPSAWQPVGEGDAPVARKAIAGPARFGPGGGGGMGGGMGGGGMMGMSLAATPELLAKLETLPPADDDPQVDVAAAAANERGEFSVLGFVRPWRRPLAFGLALVAVDAVLTLLGPLFVRNGLDDGVAAGNERAVWVAAAAFTLTVLLDWIVTWGYTWVTGRTAERALYALRIKIFAHLQRMSLDYYDRELDGRIMTRMTTDVDALSQLVQSGLIQGIVGVLTCVGVFVFLVILSPPLALATATVLPPLVLATIWYRRRAKVAYGRARDSIANVNANLQESLSGVRVSQAYVRENRNISGFRVVNGQYLADRLGAQRLIALYFPFVMFLADVGAAVVLGAGAALVSRGVVTTAVVIAFLLYVDEFFSPIQQLSQVLDTYQQAMASVDRIEELMREPTGTPPPEVPEEPGRLSGEIRFEGVHFRYPNTAGAEALSGVDLTIRPGESVALVGETGAGKSTIIKLIARFYDPVVGAVRVDGIDLRDVDLGAFRRQLGSVPQEPFLFTGTVRDNIAYGRPDASDAEVEAAARAVGAHDFVASLPGGYLAHVSERGRSLSSGQRQLIALARAQLVDPAILLLDEATSQLDLASEAKVGRAMRAVSAGRTTVLVAHRLPTARAADRIVVIDQGRVVEQGTHDELVARGGEYAGLWEAFETGAADTAPAA
jgi:ATP-binding cassette subfamily B protein